MCIGLWGESVGQLRQHLINVLACLVAIDLSFGVVVIYDRNRQASTTVSAGAPASKPAPGAVVPRPQGPPTSMTTATQPATQPDEAATAAALPSTTNAPSTRPPAVSTRESRPSRPRPGPSSRVTTPSIPAETSTSAPAGVATSPPPASTDTTAQPEPVFTNEDVTPSTDDAPDTSTTAPSTPPEATPPPSTTTSGVWTVTSDAGGDTVVDSTRAPQASARADMVESRATNTTKAIGFAVKVADPVDPTRDPTWNSTATFVLWEIDTNGDDKPDFEVEYFVEGGKLVAGVSRVTSNGIQAACEAEAGFMSASYVVGIDPACIGAPAGLAYRATVFYAVNATGDDSITDASPDGGMSAPLRRTAA